MGRPPTETQPTRCVHNLSSLTLTTAESQLLNKGLSFALTKNLCSTEPKLQLLREFNEYSKSLRRIYTNSIYYRTPKPVKSGIPTTTEKVHRPMRFLPTTTYSSFNDTYNSGYRNVEQYISVTKDNINDQLHEIFKPKTNVTLAESLALQKFKKQKNRVTIKPADKNLGVVVMDTTDYVQQCLLILLDDKVYKRTAEYPTTKITNQLQEVLSKYHTTLTSTDKRLKRFVLPNKDIFQIPQFYGIPKIHKQFKKLPPVRPIVANCNSPLTPASKLLDHVLQPLAQTYEDYLQNSACLSLILEDLQIPDNALLVAIDVNSLYPSIPQEECLQIIYTEMLSHRYTLLLDPNLIIQLLQICVNHNYFEFGPVTFQQIQGTAMGAPFSPTIANIFMSVIIRRFLEKQPAKPLLIKRYIDDIFIVWQHDENSLISFLSELNVSHQKLSYKYSYSSQQVSFLDMTIYKGPHFHKSRKLDTKTFQKQQNLYQYLHYTSNHPKHIFKSIITGECTRLVRTNTTIQEFQTMTQLLSIRLKKRDYPQTLIDKTINSVSYERRPQLLRKMKKPPARVRPPIFKCLSPPNFQLLKSVTLQHYKGLLLPSPRIINLKHQNLGKELVRAKISLNEEQTLRIEVTFDQVHQHTITRSVPTLTQHTRISKCMKPSCATCQHLVCNRFFRSSKSEKTYPIRHQFSCNSRYLIYLITCSHCKKQYVGYTTQTLRTRINHHRSNIFNKVRTYISNHFNFTDHSVRNLKVQCIDAATSFTELQALEHYWIATLRTIIPHGLNVLS
ncbi:uncharacterized protein LOC135340830 [Halichondria panicea]|uniref:uncharacterized protein LOC135340830 n=1 Tax=Halichondria panicea TaxID=6063 RepID=UPI00312BBA0F